MTAASVAAATAVGAVGASPGETRLDDGRIVVVGDSESM